MPVLIRNESSNTLASNGTAITGASTSQSYASRVPATIFVRTTQDGRDIMTCISTRTGQQSQCVLPTSRAHSSRAKTASGKASRLVATAQNMGTDKDVPRSEILFTIFREGLTPAHIDISDGKVSIDGETGTVVGVTEDMKIVQISEEVEKAVAHVLLKARDGSLSDEPAKGGYPGGGMLCAWKHRAPACAVGPASAKVGVIIKFFALLTATGIAFTVTWWAMDQVAKYYKASKDQISQFYWASHATYQATMARILARRELRRDDEENSAARTEVAMSGAIPLQEMQTRSDDSHAGHP